MKIKLEELRPNEPFPVRVAGDEAWLEGVYKHFPAPAGSARPHLSGEFLLLRLEGDFLQLTGEISYSPFVNCNRCDLPILWPINEQLDICFSPEVPQDFAGERDLTAQELDEYFLSEQGEVDLEEVINEAVVLAVPMRTIPPENSEHECQVCKMKVDSDCVYSSQLNEDDPNPFAALKGLKLDD